MSSWAYQFVSGLQRVVETTWRENRLFSALLELTYSCNLDCAFCYNDLTRHEPSLPTERWLRLLEELAELQVLNLTLSGGEPLAHPDFLTLGARGRELGFLVRLKSNGHALRGEMARRIRDQIDPFLIELSLHGAHAETHDRQTRITGSFNRLCENLEELLTLGIRLKLNSTLTCWNEDELEDMFALADRFGVPIQVDPEVTARDDGDTSPLALTASKAAIRRLIEIQNARMARAASRQGSGGPSRTPQAKQSEQAPKKEPLKQHCGAGSAGLTFDPFGNVYPCVQWRRPLGNLHRRSLRQIWFNNPALRKVRALNRQAKEMLDGQGPDAHLLNFCPGSAEAAGDPLALYPAALRRREAVLEAMAPEASLAEKSKRDLLPVLS